jgi:hypothetical protein
MSLQRPLRFLVLMHHLSPAAPRVSPLLCASLLSIAFPLWDAKDNKPMQANKCEI